MDIVGSILKKMTAPPPLSENERKLRQKNLEAEKKYRESEKIKYDTFVESIKKRLISFDQDEKQGPKLIFNPMSKPQRAVIHDISESIALVPLSFGEDEIDRHVIVYRQHTVPSEPELNALRRNEIYIPPSVDVDEQEQETTTTDKSQEQQRTNNKRKRGQKSELQQQPAEYLVKYQKVLGGLKVAKDAAKSTCSPSRSYGYVSTEQKSDRRTIEETLADIQRARKK